jgi:nitroreductase
MVAAARDLRPAAITVNAPPTTDLPGREELSPAEMLRRAREFQEFAARRRTVRAFDTRPVARELVAECLAAAGTAPSGANQQPWHFVAISDPAVKQRIRVAAEAEERQFYERRATDEWLAALEPLGTDWQKPFLETAPWLIAIFVQKWGRAEGGGKVKHYYPAESVGIATGILITALHGAGLATLTHTPSPMGFLNEILGRPADTERPFLLLVTGYPAPGVRVPAIERKAPGQVSSWFEPG